MGEVRIKRVYEDADKEDGVRILVDRLWPRGSAKKPRPWTAGSRMWHRALACAHGERDCPT